MHIFRETHVLRKPHMLPRLATQGDIRCFFQDASYLVGVGLSVRAKAQAICRGMQNPSYARAQSVDPLFDMAKRDLPERKFENQAQA